MFASIESSYCCEQNLERKFWRLDSLGGLEMDPILSFALQKRSTDCILLSGCVYFFHLIIPLSHSAPLPVRSVPLRSPSLPFPPLLNPTNSTLTEPSAHIYISEISFSQCRRTTFLFIFIVAVSSPLSSEMSRSSTIHFRMVWALLTANSLLYFSTPVPK